MLQTKVQSYAAILLNINITKRPPSITSRRHNLGDRNGRRIDAQINQISQGSIPARRGIRQRDSASDGVLAALEILVLPDPPRAVDLRVVQEEGWVTGRREEVAAWVAADGVVPTRVHAVHAVSEVTLHCVLEGVDVVILVD